MAEIDNIVENIEEFLGKVFTALEKNKNEV